MTSFRESFEASREEFAKNQSITVAALDIAMRSLTDLTDQYSQLLENSCLLCRIHYLAHSTHSFSLDELLFPLHGIHQLSIAASLSLFARTNHKDRYAILISFLRDSSELFSQIIYLACLMPVNRSISWPGHHLYTDDDLTFFCFSTFPAVFNFFLSHHDQLQAISLIEKLFNFHFMLNGSNFLKQHKFLAFFISSFFLTANPGPAFDLILPTVQEFVHRIRDFRCNYELVSANSIVRVQYWDQCITTATTLIKELRNAIPLIPTPIRFLANRLAQIGVNKPFLPYFVFDAMILNYIETILLPDHTKELRDVCDVVRCGYPRQFYQSRLRPVIESRLPARKFGILKFWEALQSETLEAEPLSLAIASCEQMSLFCARDLGLIFHSVDLFLRYGNGIGVADLVIKFAGLAAPENNKSDKILGMRNWGVASIGPDPIPPAPHGFPELFGVLATLNSAEMRSSNETELTECALVDGSLFLSPSEKVMLLNVPKRFHELPDAVVSSASHAAVAQKFTHTIFNALFSIGLEIDRTRAQSLHHLNLLIQRHVLRSLQETYPFEFAVDSLSTLSQRELTSQLLKSMEARISPRLSLAHSALLQRAIILMHVDELAAQSAGQDFSWTQHSQLALNAKSQLMRERDFGFPPGVIERMCFLLGLIDCREPPSANLKLAMAAVGSMPRIPPDVLRDVLARAGNPAIFGFIEFITPFATDRAVVAILFGDSEVVILQMFIMAGNDLLGQLQIKQRPARNVSVQVPKSVQQRKRASSRK